MHPQKEKNDSKIQIQRDINSTFYYAAVVTDEKFVNESECRAWCGRRWWGWKEGKSFTQLFFLSIAIVSAVANGAKADAKQNGRCWGGKEKCSQMSWLSK